MPIVRHGHLTVSLWKAIQAHSVIAGERTFEDVCEGKSVLETLIHGCRRIKVKCRVRL